MTATSLMPDQLPHFRQRLARREAELAEVLRHASVPATGFDEATDFKELAQEAALAAVDNAQVAQALRELDELHAARRRMDAGVYGECIECGEAIDQRRMEALPATPWCAECRALRDHAMHAARLAG